MPPELLVSVVFREGRPLSAVFAPPAAVRLPRSAAARRALLTLLFLGGFLALAVVFGGSAHAASGPDHVSHRGITGVADGLLKAERSAVSGTAGESAGGTHHAAGPQHASAAAAEVAEHRREAEQAATETTEDVIKPVTRSAHRTGKAVRPVGETVRGVTEAVDLRGLVDGIRLVRDGGGDTTGDGGGPAVRERTDAPSDDSGDSTRGVDGPAQPGIPGAALQAAPYAAPTGHSTLSDGTHQGDGPAHGPPFHRTPAVPSAGASTSVGDGQGPRGAGLHKLAGHLTGTEHFGSLRAGAVRAAHGAPTRERSGDVLEFPG